MVDRHSIPDRFWRIFGCGCPLGWPGLQDRAITQRFGVEPAQLVAKIEPRICLFKHRAFALDRLHLAHFFVISVHFPISPQSFAARTQSSAGQHKAGRGPHQQQQIDACAGGVRPVDRRSAVRSQTR